jgi:ParB family chromosome partitioning protein
VLDLAESIAAVGLIEPVAIDRQNRLLAGLHRFHAATLLLTKGASDRQRYWEELCLAAELKGKPADHERIAGLPAPDKCHLTAGTIPVRRFDIDSSRSPSQALAIEVAENEKRRDYTKAEVQALRERLETAGYSFKRGPKPEGVKAGAPLLQSIVGKSRKTIERMQKNELTSDDVNSPKPEEALSRALKRFLKEAPDSNVVPLVEPLLAAIQGGKSTINVR